MHDYKDYACKTGIPCVDPLLRFQAWRPPLVNWVKVNVDAFVPSHPHRGLGFVLRDSDGKILVAGVRCAVATWSSDISEAAAVLFCVEVAVRLGYRSVHLEGDSINVIRTIESSVSGCSPIHLLYDRISSLVSSFDAFCVSYVSRKGNSLAHVMARWDPSPSLEKLYMHSFPHELASLTARVE